MTRELSTENSGTEYIQFRGYQTSVTVEGFGIRFTTERRETPDGQPDIRGHVPLSVVSREEVASGEGPRNAVVREVAEQLIEGDLRNPLIRWGVACEHTDPETGETCERVFDTPRALSGHQRAHYGMQSSASDSDSDDSDDDDSSSPGDDDGGDGTDESDEEPTGEDLTENAESEGDTE